MSKLSPLHAAFFELASSSSKNVAAGANFVRNWARRQVGTARRNVASSGSAAEAALRP